MCGDEKCKALGLKVCPSCHSILHSIYSKASCRKDGKKPEMILPVAAIKVVKTLKFGRRGKEMPSKTERSGDLSSETESEESEEESESETESDEMQALTESDENPTESAIKPTKVKSPLKSSLSTVHQNLRKVDKI